MRFLLTLAYWFRRSWRNERELTKIHGHGPAGQHLVCVRCHFVHDDDGDTCHWCGAQLMP